MCSFSYGDIACFALNIVITLTVPFFGVHFQVVCKDTADVICGPVVLSACKAISVCVEVTFFDFC